MFDFPLAAQFIVSIAFPAAWNSDFFSFQKWWLNTLSILSYIQTVADLIFNFFVWWNNMDCMISVLWNVLSLRSDLAYNQFL